MAWHVSFLCRLTQVIGVLLWFLATMAVHSHDLVVRHAECFEHGDVVELSEHSHEEHEHESSLKQEHLVDTHGHGCLFESVLVPPIWSHSSSLTDPALYQGEALPRPSLDVHKLALLAFAPKTSPPHSPV